MKWLSNSKNSIIWNIVAMFALIGVITFFSIYLSSFNEAGNIIGISDSYGSEKFLCWTFIISSSIALLYDLARIIYKIKQTKTEN